MRSLLIALLLASTPPRISLELYRADIHNVLRLLAEVGHINIAVDDGVKGSVTLKLRNVDWRNVLELVLSSNGLGQEKLGNVVRVATLQQLASEAAIKAEIAKRQHESGPLQTTIIPVNYARAADMVPHVKALLSDRGSVTYDERTNVLIVRDVER